MKFYHHFSLFVSNIYNTWIEHMYHSSLHSQSRFAFQPRKCIRLNPLLCSRQSAHSKPSSKGWIGCCREDADRRRWWNVRWANPKTWWYKWAWAGCTIEIVLNCPTQSFALTKPLPRRCKVLSGIPGGDIEWRRSDYSTYVCHRLRDLRRLLRAKHKKKMKKK